jgi:hypothetical protein
MKKKKVICVWCNPKVKEKNTSHAICDDCAEKMDSDAWSWNSIAEEFQPRQPKCFDYFGEQRDCENCGKINNAECETGVDYLEAVEEYKIRNGGQPLTY